MLAQLLLGSGGSPLFTLGTTYIDDHVPRESSSFYIGQLRMVWGRGRIEIGIEREGGVGRDRVDDRV